MSDRTAAPTAADLFVHRLAQYGVRVVSGYPGGPLAPLYDALARQDVVRHVLPRDERAAGFLADGYARASGRPGVAIGVCGPGAFNAFTPLLTSFSDSIPTLLVSGQVPSRDPRSGYYHENDQLSAAATFTKTRGRADTAARLVPELDRLWTALTSGRPGPVLLDVVGSAFAAPAPGELPPLPPTREPLAPNDADIGDLARFLVDCERPLLLAGGGVIHAGAAQLVAQLAEALGAPVFHTFNGKCTLPDGHPLQAGLPWRQATSDMTDMESQMSPLFAQADGMLALGCRFSQVSTGSWVLKPPARLAQVDIDPDELGRHYPLELGVHADVGETLRALLAALCHQHRTPWVTPAPREPSRLRGLGLSAALRRALPREAVVVADVTVLAYQMLADFPVHEPRTFLHPAGAVSMGYGLPAALGAKLARPDRPVVAVMGDGCFQMTGMELATAVQEHIPVVVVLINDSSLSLIRAIQKRRYEGRYFGVDLRNPDFGTFAAAFGVWHRAVESEEAFEAAVRAAVECGEPAVVEVRLRRPE